MVKRIVLTAIHFKGIEKVKTEVKELAEKILCSESYIKSIIKQVEKNQIEIKKDKRSNNNNRAS
jgi:DNA-binding MarR family transcriptional regulator